MRHLGRFAISIVFLLMVLTTVGCQSQAQKEKLASLEQQVSTLQSEKAQLQQRIENLTRENEGLQAHLEALKMKPRSVAKKK